MEESVSLLGQLKQSFALKEVDIRTYSPLTLAYIGDCVFDLLIRTVVVERGNEPANKLHRKTVTYVKAETQAAMIEALLDDLTQEELADRAELSKGFISQLERDLTSPSIATLVDILQCLGTDLEEFFSGTAAEQVVFRKGDYFEKEDAELHNRIEWIIPNAQKNMMEPILLTLAPDGSTYPDNPHEGEEFGYILNGSIELFIGSKKFREEKAHLVGGLLIEVHIVDSPDVVGVKCSHYLLDLYLVCTAPLEIA